MIRSARLALILLAAASCRTEPESAPAAMPEKRVPWTASRVAGSPDPPLPYQTKRAFPKLGFRHSLFITFEPTTGRMMTVVQEGRVHAFPNDPAVEKADLFFERKGTWFYSMMFHPKYAENHWVYFFSNGPPDTEPNKKNRILRYVVKDGRVDPSTEHLVIEWTSNGHDGGEMGFGPDGMLYISAGDGTTDSDRNVTGQDISDLNSGMIRIDVEHPDPGKGYSIPKDNPFLSIPGARGELWAYGFRNPWRMTFDPKTGDLWVGDIGQDLWEMVELVQKGDNYGWSVMEGGHPFHSLRKVGPTPIKTAAIVHPHSEARSITGGIVYTGPKYKELQGAYLYGDYGTGKIWMARAVNGKITANREIADTPYQMLGFAQDAAGEIYIVDYAGAIYQLEPTPPDRPQPVFPRTLSASGVFTSVAGYQLDPGLIPYTVNAPLWSDGAFKERHLGIPGDGRIDFSEDGAWNFPDGAVLVKTFSLERERGNPSSRRRIETRYLVKQQNEWVGYSYEWNDAQTDATLVDAPGKTRDYTIRDGGSTRKQSWYYPSRADCMVCHSRAANYVLGLSTIQMNREGQLEGLERLGFFKVDALEHLRLQQERWKKRLVGPLRAVLPRVWQQVRNDLSRRTKPEQRTTGILPKSPADYDRLADPYDATADLGLRARAYLHSNCAQCHVEAGGGNSAIDLHIGTKPDRMRLFDVKPQHDPLGLADPRIVASGAPERSVLFQRISRRGPGQMPPLATSAVDERALAMLREWISSLKP
ncbi:MAG: PQQ-dependent sugar dehydrogenase [Planctomycetes bacterium]|nr:PQQ-dependent sugar dehydrogenase [Planctomycetota bacterium]